MPAPTGADGFERSLQEAVGAIVAAIIVIAILIEFLGVTVAGIVYLFISVVGYLILLMKSKHWNIPYTATFLFGFVLFYFIMPSVAGELLHPIFRYVSLFLGMLFILGLASVLSKKLR